MNEYLCHYGVSGQRWGVRRYQNPDGTYTEEGKHRRRIDDYKESAIANSAIRQYAAVYGGYNDISDTINLSKNHKLNYLINTYLTSALVNVKIDDYRKNKALSEIEDVKRRTRSISDVVEDLSKATSTPYTQPKTMNMAELVKKTKKENAQINLEIRAEKKRIKREKIKKVINTIDAPRQKLVEWTTDAITPWLDKKIAEVKNRPNKKVQSAKRWIDSL